MTTNHYDVVIVGGGLAGLSSAAYLSSKGKKVAVLERGQLGGRAVTLKIKGFNFNRCPRHLCSRQLRFENV